jgi:hypothetical protein
MPKLKLVLTVKRFRIESGGVVEIWMQPLYDLVAPEEAGFDVFDEDQLNLVKKNFIALSESQFNFTISPLGLKHYYRVFAEKK